MLFRPLSYSCGVTSGMDIKGCLIAWGKYTEHASRLPHWVDDKNNQTANNCSSLKLVFLVPPHCLIERQTIYGSRES